VGRQSVAGSFRAAEQKNYLWTAARRLVNGGAIRAGPPGRRLARRRCRMARSTPWRRRPSAPVSRSSRAHSVRQDRSARRSRRGSRILWRYTTSWSTRAGPSGRADRKSAAEVAGGTSRQVRGPLTDSCFGPRLWWDVMGGDDAHVGPAPRRPRGEEVARGVDLKAARLTRRPSGPGEGTGWKWKVSAAGPSMPS